ncbi:MAG: ATP-binding protein [Candidatus Cyclobacteriaceae bacterium M2_1C_046]
MIQFLSHSLELKEKRITRYLASLALAVSVFYLIFDFFLEAYGYIAVYLILLIGAVLCLISLKKDNLTTAKIILISSGTIVVTAFASVENLETGIYFYYVVISLSSFTLFGYRQLYYAVGFSFLSLVLFMVVYFTDLQLMPSVPITEEYIRASLFVNYLVSMLASSLMLFYLIKNNHQAEQTLLLQRTDLAKTAEELERSQRRFELAIQGSSAAIWDWDIKNDKLHITPKLGEILDRPLSSIQGKTQEQFNNIIHPDDLPGLTKMLQEHFKTHNSFEIELRLRKGNGDYVWVLDTGQAEWDRNNKPVRMVGTIVDISEKKLAVERVREQNEMLEKANQELDRFVYSTSHDLRAPLSSLLGLINLAGLSTIKEERDELIEMMKNQIVKLDSYIQNITDYSRNTRINVQDAEINLYEVVQEAINDLKYMEGADRLNIICEIDKEKNIFTDKERLKVIVSNLISNAIKYQDVKKASALKIESGSQGNADYIIFSDNGIGIEKDHLDKIFNMFYRASDTSRGSGLGLYIVKEIADKLHAGIEVASIFGEGTTFKVKLPSNNLHLA